MVKPNITPKEFEDSLLEPEIIDDTPTIVEDTTPKDKPEQLLEPEFLTKEEEEHDKHLEETLGWDKEE